MVSPSSLWLIIGFTYGFTLRHMASFRLPICLHSQQYGLFQEQKKSKILQESMLKLDAEMKRTDSLLYQMIPKPVADRLRRGEPAISTCEVSAASYRYSKICIFRPPLGPPKSGLKDHFWTVPKVVSNQRYTGCRT